MAWLVSKDLDAYLEAAGGLLRSRPVQNTVVLTVTETLQASGPSAYGEPGLFGWWREDGGAVTAAFLITPPYPLQLVDVPDDALEPLVVTLRRLGHPLTGLAGEAGLTERFAAAWGRRTGAGSRVIRRERLYRLGELTRPEPAPPGAARVAGPADRTLLRAWHQAFAQDIGEDQYAIKGVVDDRLAARGYLLWEVDGRPVAMAGLTRQIAGMVRVGAVYTPDAHRGQGYGGAVTAAACGQAIAEGAADVLLFADLANPVSNRVYQRLGFASVFDRLVVAFTG